MTTLEYDPSYFDEDIDWYPEGDEVIVPRPEPEDEYPEDDCAD